MNRIVSALFMGALISACSDGSGPSARRDVTIGFAGATPASFSSGASFSVSTSDNGNVLVIDTVKMTLEDIDLERADQSVDCSVAEGASHHADCSDYFPGPYLVLLDLDGGSGSPLVLPAQIGTYDTVSFDISVPDGGDPAQEAYLAANPDMRGVSLRIVGRYNGEPFSFALTLTGDQEIPISPALEVTGSSLSLFSLTMNFDVASWFRRADGSLIDPRTICSADAGCADRSTVEDNVEKSIEAYPRR